MTVGRLPPEARAYRLDDLLGRGKDFISIKKHLSCVTADPQVRRLDTLADTDLGPSPRAFRGRP